MSGANLLIPDQICDELSYAGQGKVYGLTDRRRQRQYPFGLKGQGGKMELKELINSFFIPSKMQLEQHRQAYIRGLMIYKLALTQVTRKFILLYIYTVDSHYLAPVGSQNSRARVKWFSRYLALLRERPNSRLPGSESHTVTSAPLKPKQYVER